MSNPPTPIYEFGDFRLDSSRRLLCREDGSVVPLTARVFETLLYLVEHSGAVLERDQLMDAVWPDAVVEENNLTQNISTLRRVLGERPGSNQFIVTVPGRGYRFVAAVSRAKNGAASEQEMVASSLPSAALAPGESPQAGSLRYPGPSPVPPKWRGAALFGLAVLALVVAGAFFGRCGETSSPR